MEDVEAVAKAVVVSVIFWVFMVVVSAMIITSYKYRLGVAEGRLIEIDAKVKLMEKNWYPDALPEVMQ